MLKTGDRVMVLSSYTIDSKPRIGVVEWISYGVADVDFPWGREYLIPREYLAQLPLPKEAKQACTP